MVEEHTFILPLKWKPSEDCMIKLLLNDPKIINLVVRSLIDNVLNTNCPQMQMFLPIATFLLKLNGLMGADLMCFALGLFLTRHELHQIPERHRQDAALILSCFTAKEFLSRETYQKIKKSSTFYQPSDAKRLFAQQKGTTIQCPHFLIWRPFITEKVIETMTRNKSNSIWIKAFLVKSVSHAYLYKQ